MDEQANVVNTMENGTSAVKSNTGAQKDALIEELKDIISALPLDGMAESYLQYEEYKKHVNDWSDETKTRFLKAHKGPGTGQSCIENSVIEQIKKEDLKFVQTFKENNLDYGTFENNFVDLLVKRKNNKKTPWQVIRAMAIMLRPTEYCQIADPIKLKDVCKFLNDKYKVDINKEAAPDEESDENSDDWNSINKAVQEYFCKYAVEERLITDAVIELIKKIPNKTQQDYENEKDELSKFVKSFIPWEFYEKKVKIDSLVKRLKACKNIIFTGAPGTGKTYLADQIAKEFIKGNPNNLDKTQGAIGFTQFHPSYDYTDFVEGLRPNKKNSFDRVDGVFKSFCKKAIDKPDANFVFIIDEINRGEISKIFGELFFSIDPGYRKESGKEVRVQTQYQNLITDRNDPFKSGFYVPTNVYIIGTMNDIDRSVESMDFAFRRRFAFFEISAEDSMGMLVQLGKKANDARKVMKALNDALVSPDKGGLTYAYQIGGSYFLKLKQDDDKFISFGELWEYYLKGTLYEYFRGEPNADKIMSELQKVYRSALTTKKQNAQKEKQ